ncbi:hypothetical protein ACFPDQ_00430 [Pseudofrancisella aestuarii]|uniref:Uncharacterized protein n=1 Tax=Pseudofrancisella aestuarii TaxID=2670347 RepID=A0ABV9T9P2_9GAMM|nr:hypothetical protein [Pseudofrancisella aestuarii]
MIKNILLVLLFTLFSFRILNAYEINAVDGVVVNNTYPKGSLEYKVARLNSNAQRRLFIRIANNSDNSEKDNSTKVKEDNSSTTVNNNTKNISEKSNQLTSNKTITEVDNQTANAPKKIGQIASSDTPIADSSTKGVSKETLQTAAKDASTAVDSLEMQEGQSLTDSQRKALQTTAFQRKMNQALDIDALKFKYFNGFKLSETLSHAMLNVQQDTGDPLFMLEARQQGILEDDYIYFGAKLAALGWMDVSPVPPGATAKSFSYAVNAYVASTISPWFTSLLGFSLYSSDERKLNFDPNTIYLILGNLSESPYFGYAAISTVMFGNFDIVSNYVPTVTRQYFMQSGGNVNISYHTDSLHLNGVILTTNNSLPYLGTTNAGTNSGVGFSLNSKYVYEMETVGDYQFFGAAYTNATGFKGKGNSDVGAFDINYGLSYSKINFETEALITDSGVIGLNDSSALSPKNVAGAPFFGSIKPSTGILLDNYMSGGGPVATWALNLSYTAEVFGRSLIPFIDYSHVFQDTHNYAYNYGAGVRYILFQGSWLGLDYANLTTRSPNIKESQNYLNVNFTVYI